MKSKNPLLKSVCIMEVDLRGYETKVAKFWKR